MQLQHGCGYSTVYYFKFETKLCVQDQMSKSSDIVHWQIYAAQWD